MIVEIIIFIIFLVLVIPQILHWMNVFAKGYVKKKNKVILDQYKKMMLQNLQDKKSKKEDKDMRGYA